MDLFETGDPVHISAALPQLVPCDECEGPMWRPDAGHTGRWLCAFCKPDEKADNGG